MESGRRIFIMGYDPLGWGGELMELGRKKYHGIRLFRVGEEHSWNQEEEILSWDTLFRVGGQSWNQEE